MAFTRFLTALLIALTLAGSGRAADTLYLNSGVGAPYAQADHGGLLDLLVPELFARLGLKAETQLYPSAERALINANSGLDDGDAMRVGGLDAIYPNLVRVPEKVADNNFVAFSLRHDVPPPDYAALRPYSLAYIVGWKILEADLADGFQATRVQNAEQLFTLLGNDRADMVLIEEWQGRWMAQRLGLSVTVLAPPLASREMFVYLHRRHAALVDRAAEELRAMKADGTYQRIAEQTLLRLVRQREPRS